MSTARYSVGVGPLRKPVSVNKIIHLLVPDVVVDDGHVRSKDEQLTHNADKEDYIKELTQLATELNLKPIIHRLIMTNIKSSIDKIPVNELIMNLCDGSDLDGVPGPSVAACLEEKKYPNVVGCDSLFINNTLTKNGMKEIFQKNLVASPPGFGATKETNLDDLVNDNGLVFPLFVKVSDSYGSVGLDDDSVCHTMEDLKRKCDKLLKDFPSLTIEEFIDGPEFSVLVSGNCRDPNQTVIVYPPAERAFKEGLSKYQKFISFHRNWDAEALAHDYAPVNDPNDYNALQDLSRRAYTAVSGNCYGRVDIRKRDINGKFYVLEVNASCGLGKGSSSDFILNLAGQSTKDFFEILLSSALKPGIVDATSSVPTQNFISDLVTTEPESLHTEAEDVLKSLPSIIPPSVEKKVARMIRHPSLSTMPTPVVHVIVAGVLVDLESGIADPEGKLAQTWGKDAEYVSELEEMIRAIGYDPIVHLYRVDPVEEILAQLNVKEDVVLNACLGQDGLEVSQIIEKRHFNHSVGLNARFFEESHDRIIMKRMLEKHGLSTPRSFVYSKKMAANYRQKYIEDFIIQHNISFPVYVKPATARLFLHGQHSGKKVFSEEQLAKLLKTLESDDEALIEEFIEGREYRVLVAGDARDPDKDIIVFPPVCNTMMNQVNETSDDDKEPLFLKELPSGSQRTLNMNNTGVSMNPITSSSNNNNSYRSMEPEELMLQMDIQDLARRAYVAVHGSCYGIVTILDYRPPQPISTVADDNSCFPEVHPIRYGGNQLHVLGVSGDVRFGENAKAGTVLSLAKLNAETLFAWLLKRAGPA